VTDAFAAQQVRCGQTVDGDAVLSRSCIGDIVLRGVAPRLNLAGRTIRGTVQCQAAYCEVVSDPPDGQVRGAGEPGSVGIRAGDGANVGAGDVAVDSVVVTGFTTGIAASSVQLTNSLVADNLGYGVEALHSIEAVASIVTDNGMNGLHAKLGGVSIADCEVTENRFHGVRALEGFIADHSIVSGNGDDGVQNFSARSVVVDSTITGNGGHGLRTDDSDCTPTDGVELHRSTVVDNGLGRECGQSRPCADLVACVRPDLDSLSRCGTSHQMRSGLPGQSWQVCADD